MSFILHINHFDVQLHEIMHITMIYSEAEICNLKKNTCEVLKSTNESGTQFMTSI